MIEIVKAAGKAGIAALVTYWLTIILTGEMVEAPIQNLALGFVLSIPLIWIFSFLISISLLLPLYPIFRVFPRSVSLAIFLSIGFILPALAMAWMNSAAVHGNPPVISQEDFLDGTIVLGTIGFASAGTAWFSLYRNCNSRIEQDDGIKSVTSLRSVKTSSP
jgi:hypothetical protein